MLPDPQREALRIMAAPLARRRFHLGGGTAVALHIGHRVSLDLDWFVDGDLGDPLFLARELEGEGVDLATRDVARGTLHGEVLGVRVSLIEFRYPLLEPVVVAEPGHVPVASLADLAAMKLAAVAQRGAKRDFVDVHALGTAYRPLRDLLSLYARRFGVRDVAHVLYGLTYFDDAEPEQMPRMLRDVPWETVKSAIRAWVKATPPA